MNERSSDSPWRPGPEHLAAYVDDALDARTQRALEAWLCRNPDVAADLEAHRELHRLWDRSTPDEPPAAKWSGLRQEIALALFRPKRIPAGRRGWWALAIAAGTAAASALVAFVILRGSGQDRPLAAVPESPLSVDANLLHSPSDPPSLPSILEVLAPDEVEIISMDLRDRNALVIGTLPLRQPLALLTPEEVTVEQVEQGSPQRKPEFTAEPTPMLWVPNRTPER